MQKPVVVPAIRPVWLLLGAASIAFHLWLIFSGLVPNLVSRPLHMALAVPWIMLVAGRGRVETLVGWGLGLGAIAVCFWIALTEASLSDQYGSLSGQRAAGGQCRCHHLRAGNGPPGYWLAVAVRGSHCPAVRPLR